MALRTLKTVVNSREGEILMEVRGPTPAIIDVTFGAMLAETSLVHILMAGCTFAGFHLGE